MKGKSKGSKGKGTGSQQAPVDDPYNFSPGGQRITKVSIDNKKTKWCGAWNSARGCVPNQRNCPQKAQHGCNVMISKGIACGSRQHDCSGHFVR